MRGALTYGVIDSEPVIGSPLVVHFLHALLGDGPAVLAPDFKLGRGDKLEGLEGGEEDQKAEGPTTASGESSHGFFSVYLP